MQTMTAKDYNTMDMRKWNERVEEWHKDKFSHNIIPQIAFVGFRKNNGDFKNYGFVALDEHSAYWAKTKWEVKKRYADRTGLTVN